MSNRVSGGQNLVVVLGWMGASARHVQKYADWWNYHECDTIINCGTPFSTYYPPEGKKMAGRLMKKIQKHLDENPNCDSIIFHAFSNGGGFPLSHILSMLSEEKYRTIREKVKVNILDSMLDVFVSAAFRAFTALKLPFVFSIVFYLLFPVIMMLGFITGFFNTIMQNYAKNKIPTLVLYSTGDKICLPHEIEYFIKFLKDNKIPTSSHKFHSSDHVAHFRSHKEEYSNVLYNFLSSNNVKLANKQIDE